MSAIEHLIGGQVLRSDCVVGHELLNDVGGVLERHEIYGGF